jgi:broad specificity phosphatase PhoE
MCVCLEVLVVKSSRVVVLALSATLFFCLALAISFAWGALVVRHEIFPYQALEAVPVFALESEKDQAGVSAADRYWAQKVIDGGYILHFRHAQREKWNDVAAFDAYDLLRGSGSAAESYAKAVCLTEQGVEESRLIGSVFRLLNVKVARVIASPSCRAKETAQYAFGRIDGIDNSLLHRTAIPPEQWDGFAAQLRSLILSIDVQPGTNVVLSGHGRTLGDDGDRVIDVDETQDVDGRDETGFVVLERVEGKVIARHKFTSFKNFVNAILEVPLT